MKLAAAYRGDNWSLAREMLFGRSPALVVDGQGPRITQSLEPGVVAAQKSRP